MQDFVQNVQQYAPLPYTKYRSINWPVVCAVISITFLHRGLTHSIMFVLKYLYMFDFKYFVSHKHVWPGVNYVSNDTLVKYLSVYHQLYVHLTCES